MTEIMIDCDDDEDDCDWRMLGLTQFIKDDPESDSIYDDLRDSEDTQGPVSP